MIEKMHKYTFLVFHKQYNDFLYKLQEVGVLHVKEKPEGNTENDALRDKLQLAAQVDKTIGEAFALLTPDMQPLPQEEQFDGAQLVNEFVEMKEEALRIETALDRTQKEADRMAVWGNYSTDLLHKLADEGFVLQFFSIGKARFNQEWETEKNAFVVADNGSTLYFVTVNRQPVELDADVVTLNEHNQMQLEQDMQNLKGLLVAQQGKMYENKLTPKPAEQTQQTPQTNQPKEGEELEPVRTYVPSSAPVKLANAQQDTSAVDAALKKSDDAEKLAMETLAMKW